MKKISHRDRLKIYGDILSALYKEGRAERIILTRVQLRANVPFDRLKSYLAELKDLGLIQQEPSLRLTEKGKQYLTEYEKVLEFVKRMGLVYS